MFKKDDKTIKFGFSSDGFSSCQCTCIPNKNVKKSVFFHYFGNIIYYCYFSYSLKDIAAANIIVHELRCKKHLTVCTKCGYTVPKTELAKHNDEEHKVVNCDECKEAVTEKQLDDHKVAINAQHLSDQGIFFVV